jgi:hypothetical protein
MEVQLDDAGGGGDDDVMADEQGRECLMHCL